MSSPDPLNDETALTAPPSSQRTARSVRSSRATPRPRSRSGSPRKQQFELEVGDNTSPQRLLVTVETDDAPPSTATRRRLFSSASPHPRSRPRISATTTTVPLKDSIEDEFDVDQGNGDSTLKRRGRPRKTNGTPLPSAAKKRRAGTPIRRTPKRQNTTTEIDPIAVEDVQGTPTPRRRGRLPKSTPMLPSSDIELGSEPQSDQLSQATPTPKRRGRPPKDQSIEPPSDVPLPSTTKPGSIRSVRRRRQALAPEDLEDLVEEQAQHFRPQQLSAPTSDDGMELIGQPEEDEQPEPVYTAPSPPQSREGSDTWMPTEREEETPRANQRTINMEPSSPFLYTRRLPAAAVEDLPSEAEGFGDGAPSPSQTSSVDQGRDIDITRRNDTVAQEDFSMIFMDSIPSFQEFKSSLNGPAPAADTALGTVQEESFQDDLGEETNYMINQSLASLRQSLRADETADEEALLREAPEEDAADHMSGREMEFVEGYSVIAPENQGSESDADDGNNELIPEMTRTDARSLEQGSEMGENDLEEEDAVDIQPPMDERDEQSGLLGSQQNEGDERPEAEFEAELPQQSHEDPILVASVPASVRKEYIGTVQTLSSSSPPPREDDELASDELTPVQPIPAPSSSRASHLFSSRLSHSPLKANISPLRRRVLDSSARHPDITPRPLAMKPIRPSSGLRPFLGRSNIEDESNQYDDSFSEIPEQILDAATPGRPATIPIDEPEDSGMDQDDDQEGLNPDAQEEEADEEPEEIEAELQPSSSPMRLASETVHQPAPSAASSGAQTDNGRLPTPDDTPPNIDADAHTLESPEKSVQMSLTSSPLEPHLQLASEHDAAPAPEPIPEAPVLPHQARFSGARSSSALEITPANQMSSPAQEPQSVAAPESPQDKAPRPALSAIVRAGRVLQSMTSDPPSPDDRQNQLGSPFRSSASKESWSGSRDAPSGNRFSNSPRMRFPGHQRQSASIDKALENMARESRLSGSPGGRFVGHRRQSASVDLLNEIPIVGPSSSPSPVRRSVNHQSRSVSRDRPSDDPFTSRPSNPIQSSFLQALEKGNRESRERSRAPSAGSVASSMRITPADEEMSWVANEGPISPKLRGDRSLKEVAEASLPGAARSSTTHKITSDAGPVSKPHLELEPGSEPAQAEDESEVEEQRQEEPDERDDETDIWEVEAERSELRSSQHQHSFNHQTSAPLHQRSALPNSWTRKTGPFGNSLRASQRSARSAFANSTQQPEGDTEEYSLLEQRQKEAEAATATASAKKPSGFDLGAFFSSPAAIPGMLAERLFPSKPNTSILEGSSMLAVVPTNSMFPSMAQKPTEPQEESRVEDSRLEDTTLEEFQPEEPPSNQAFSVPSKGVQEKQQAPQGSESPDTPENLQIPISARKKDFTPRPRQTNQSFFRSSTSTARPSAAPTPPRMQLSHADIQRWQQQTSNASEEDVRNSPPRRFLRPLPPRNASPTKSSLRSPLKPHTPGRVVDFTSSVLSPADQARQRQEQRRSSNAGEAEEFSEPEESAERPNVVTDETENHDSDVSMSDAEPLAKTASGPEMLSQTTWTRQHWLFMDKLIQHRRKTRFGLEVDRTSARLLGKKVKSHGQSLVLEQWHLDCVDAFKSVVGGWDEGVLAKRLFALLKGQERREQLSRWRRKEEEEEEREEVMFH